MAGSGQICGLRIRTRDCKNSANKKIHEKAPLAISDNHIWQNHGLRL